MTSPVVDTRAGAVRGHERAPGDAAFLGVPFAAAPSGEKRFGAPVEVEPWHGVRDAIGYGATPQRGHPGVTLIPEPSVPGDATLNVNIFTPAPGDVGARLPVMVWIHGGGFVAGSPAGPWYDGSRFSRDGIVTVVISYRLGFDGFGLLPDAPANRAVRDWLAALQWVRDNIAEFGGDPAQVTVAGQSAGGAAVLTLLGMPSAHGLFARAMALSPALSDMPRERAERVTRSLARRLRVPPTRAGFASRTETEVLRAQSAVVRQNLRGALTSGLAFAPVTDGDLLAHGSLAALRSGAGAGVPLVVGALEDEFSGVARRLGPLLRVVPRRRTLSLFGIPAERRAAYVASYPDHTPAELAGQAVTDLVFRRWIPAVADARGSSPTWAQRFVHRSASLGIAAHCVDVPFFFDCLDSPIGITALLGEHPPQALADEVHGAAVAFIRGNDPAWPPFAEQGTTAIFGETRGVRITTHGYDAVRPLLP